MRLLVFAILLFSFFACTKKGAVPEGILPPERMQLIFWDYVRADVYTRDYLRKDSALNDTAANLSLQNRIFRHYGISREKFYDSYDYYVAHPEMMTVMLDSMIRRQSRVHIPTQRIRKLNE